MKNKLAVKYDFTTTIAYLEYHRPSVFELKPARQTIQLVYSTSKTVRKAFFHFFHTKQVACKDKVLD